MADTKTTLETARSPVDGTELVRLATSGANWKATLAAIFGTTTGVTDQITVVGTLTAGAVPKSLLTGLGTGVSTALGVNVGSAGAPVLFNGALGTPSSGTLTSATGLPPAGVVGTAAILGANTFTGAQVVSGASFGLSGNISAAAWTTSGVRYKNVAATLTDTSSSGTVAAAYTDVWGGNTIAASSATTFTNYYGSYFAVPVVGTNVTFTNGWALGADSALINGALKATGAVTLGAGPAILSSPTAAVFQHGAADVASGAVAQFIRAQSNTGAATTGPDFTIQGTKGTTIGGNLIFQTAATTTYATAMTITPIGFVGIGITNPTLAALEVRNNNQDPIRWGSSSTAVGVLTWSGSAGSETSVSIGAITNIPLNLRVNSATRFSISSTAGTVKFGAADAASPVAQIATVQNVVAGNANTAGVPWTLIGSLSNGSGVGGDIILQTSLASAASGSQNTAATALTLKAGTQAVLALSPTGGLGYGTGAGGAVTQITNKSTGVTLNTVTGQITMNNANLGGQAEVSFTLTNSAIAATDIVVVNIGSGATANSYIASVGAVAAGSCVIQLANVTLATTLGEAVVLNFAVIKGVTS